MKSNHMPHNLFVCLQVGMPTETEQPLRTVRTSALYTVSPDMCSHVHTLALKVHRCINVEKGQYM